MKASVRFATSALIACLLAQASGPVAVYALIDRVSLEPNADKPERIRISGVFLTAAERTDQYSEPQRGYLYFSLPPNGGHDLAVREWNDLKSLAGTRQVLGIGSSWAGAVHVRKSGTEAEPEPYVMGNGLVRVNADQPRAKALLEYKDR